MDDLCANNSSQHHSRTCYRLVIDLRSIAWRVRIDRRGGGKYSRPNPDGPCFHLWTDRVSEPAFSQRNIDCSAGPVIRADITGRMDSKPTAERTTCRGLMKRKAVRLREATVLPTHRSGRASASAY